MEFLFSTPMPVADHFMASGGGAGAGRGGAVCEKCMAYFADDVQLWLHVRREHGRDKRLACPAPGCGKRFLSRDLRTRHLAHHRGAADGVGGARTPVPPPVRPHTCELCGRLSVSQKALDKHTANRHPAARRYACGVCALLVRDVPALARHVRRRHAAELTGVKRELRCEICAKLFGNRMMLRKHRPVHGAGDSE